MTINQIIDHAGAASGSTPSPPALVLHQRRPSGRTRARSRCSSPFVTRPNQTSAILLAGLLAVATSAVQLTVPASAWAQPAAAPAPAGSVPGAAAPPSAAPVAVSSQNTAMEGALFLALAAGAVYVVCRGSRRV
jgi:hypothetical protein